METTTSAPGAATVLTAARGSRPKRRSVAQLLVRNRMAVVGAIVVILWVCVALLAPLIPPYHPIDQDVRARLRPPTADHWLGPDGLGRHVFSRVLWGGRVSLPVAAIVVVLASLFGTVYGGAAGLFCPSLSARARVL